MADPNSGAMVALAPTDEHANSFAVAGGLPPEELHLTLAYLGDAIDLSTDEIEYCQEVCEQLSALYQPMDLMSFASASFNPNSEQAAVYLMDGGNAEEVAELAQELCAEFVPSLPEQHSPWIPHMTIGYDMGVDKLVRCESPVRFDKIRLAIGDQVFDYPLGVPNDDFDNPLVSSMAKLDQLICSIEDVLVSAGYDIPSPKVVKGSKKAQVKNYIDTKSKKAVRYSADLARHQEEILNPVDTMV